MVFDLRMYNIEEIEHGLLESVIWAVGHISNVALVFHVHSKGQAGLDHHGKPQWNHHGTYYYSQTICDHFQWLVVNLCFSKFVM